MNIEPKQRVRIKAGWDRAGRKGRCLALVELAESDHIWAVVKWDDEDDPDNHKVQGLEVVPHEDIRWPRPWTQRTFLVNDAKGREVLHFGGIAPKRDGYDLEALVGLIVEAVNKYSEEPDVESM